MDDYGTDKVLVQKNLVQDDEGAGVNANARILLCIASRWDRNAH